MKKQDAARIYTALLKRYPESKDVPGTVARGTPFEVIVLTILSAQTTDKAVLKVKKPLFTAYPTPVKLAKAKQDDVEKIIHSLGYYHAKAKNIIAASQALLDNFGGSVPETMDELLTIPGVGRKTANIVLYHALGKNEGIAVDTHVRRLAQRIGFSDTDNVEVIERDLMALFPRKDWGDVTDVLIAHGRATCDAKKPLCTECVISRGMPVVPGIDDYLNASFLLSITASVAASSPPLFGVSLFGRGLSDMQDVSEFYQIQVRFRIKVSA